MPLICVWGEEASNGDMVIGDFFGRLRDTRLILRSSQLGLELLAWRSTNEKMADLNNRSERVEAKNMLD